MKTGKCWESKYTYGYLANRKGITLIALVITIIVLLILAGVSISMVAGENGILDQATSAKEEQLLAEEKEKVQMAVGGAQIEKIGVLEKDSLDAHLKLGFGEGNYTLEETDKFKITIKETGNLYEVDKTGKVSSYKGISLSKNTMNLKIEAGIYPTEDLTVSQYQIEDNITWEISDSSIATISSDTGNTVTVTAVNKGETTVTVSCGEYTETCTITVDKGIMLGNYVKYDISYTDAIKTSLSYDSTNGWRYMGKDTITGEHLLISTGMAAKWTLSTSEQTWWGSDTDEEGNVRLINQRIAEGLKNNFINVPFKGSINGNTTTDITGASFLSGNATAVTMLENSSGTSGVKLPSDWKSMTTGDVKGLFDLYKLKSTYSGSYCCIAAGPKSSSYEKRMYSIYFSSSTVLDWYTISTYGIRPVIKFPATTTFELSDEGNYFEIK